MSNFVSILRLTLKSTMIIRNKVFFIKYTVAVTESYSFNIAASEF